MKEGRDYFDISPLLCEATAVFPGDQPFRRKIALDFKKGDHLLLSSFETSVHIGAHADAPNHYDKNGGGIAERDLSYYMGLCEVITVKPAMGERVMLRHLDRLEMRAPRILFRTRSFPDQNTWNSDFNSLSPEVIDHLAKVGVCLVGIDTPSIDPENSKALESHAAVAKHGLAILEGLVLEDVEDGLYSLIALPLRLQDCDASPVRAILLKDFQIFP